MKILQRNLNRSTFVVWEMKRNVSVVRFKFRCNILVSGKIIKEMPGSVASGTLCIMGWNSHAYIYCKDGQTTEFYLLNFEEKVHEMCPSLYEQHKELKPLV